jgi:hypothetical protein
MFLQSRGYIAMMQSEIRLLLTLSVDPHVPNFVGIHAVILEMEHSDGWAVNISIMRLV